MRVFLDTNVLVSALGTRGICADLLRHVLAEHDWLCSDHVSGELVRVLATKFAMPASLIAQVESFVQSRAEHVPTVSELDVSIRDPDDVPVLGAAVAGRADVLITGDRDLLVLGKVGRVHILDVRGFWEMVTGAG